MSPRGREREAPRRGCCTPFGERGARPWQSAWAGCGGSLVWPGPAPPSPASWAPPSGVDDVGLKLLRLSRALEIGRPGQPGHRPAGKARGGTGAFRGSGLRRREEGNVAGAAASARVRARVARTRGPAFRPGLARLLPLGEARGRRPETRRRRLVRPRDRAGGRRATRRAAVTGRRDRVGTRVTGLRQGRRQVVENKWDRRPFRLVRRGS